MSTKILVVEDEPALQKAVCRVLREAGYEVAAASNGEEALALVGKDFDIILTDLKLPGRVDGNELARCFRKTGTADVILMTAFPQLDTAIRGMREGTCDYLLKPVSDIYLLAVIKRCVEKRTLSSELRREKELRATLVREMAQSQRLHQQLRESEETLRLTIAGARVGTWAWDAATDLVTWSAETAAIFGRDAAVRRTFADFVALVHPDDRKILIEDARRRRAGSGDLAFEYRCVRPDGEVRWISARANCVIDDHGQVRRIIGIDFDITDRKRAEHEREFRASVLETEEAVTPDGILVVDHEGRVVASNRRFQEMWGIPRELVEARDNRALIDNVSEKLLEPAGFLARIRELDAKKDETSRDEIRLKDGRTFERHTAPMKTSDGRHLGRVCFFRDATESLQARRQLERQAKFLRTISLCDEALVRAKSEKDLLDAICRIVVEHGGYLLSWVGLRVDDAAHSVRVAACAGKDADYTNLLNLTWADEERGRGPTGTAIRESRAVVCADLETDPRVALWRDEALKRCYRASVALPLKAEGRAFGALRIYGANPDCFGEQEMVLLTELADDLAYGVTALRGRAAREAAEAALREREENLASAQRIAHLGSWEWRLRKNQLDWSDETYRIFGQEPGSFKPSFKSFVEALLPEDRPAVMHAIQKALRGRTGYRADFRLLRPGGGVRHAHAEAEVRRDPAGRPVAVRGTVLDVTERKQLEAAALHAQKMDSVGRLAGGVAHDFNNLLMVILANCGFVLKALAADDPTRGDVLDIKEAAERAAALTRQLLIFSRKQTPHPETIDLNAAVRNLQKMLKRLIGEDILIEEAYWPEPLPVRIDPGQLEQAVTNLAVNARDALPKGGRVAFRTRLIKKGEPFCPPGCLRACTGVCARLEIEDDGVGMPPEVQAHLFEPFFTTKDPGKGTGLGLSTVYGIIRQAEGAITVRSAPGKGSLFAVTLPRQTQTDAAGAGAGPAPRGEEIVLLVEDEEAVRRVDGRILRELGYGVIETSGGEQALAVLKDAARPIDLMLSDVVMPGMSGPSLARESRKLRPELKVLFMSGYPDRADPKSLDEDLLPKPASAEALARKVREVLDGKGAITS